MAKVKIKEEEEVLMETKKESKKFGEQVTCLTESYSGGENI